MLNEYAVAAYELAPSYLFNDNKGTTQTVNNPDTNTYTKFVDTKYFKTRQYVANAMLKVAYIPTHLNVADFFTKALEFTLFNRFRTYLGVIL